MRGHAPVDNFAAAVFGCATMDRMTASGAVSSARRPAVHARRRGFWTDVRFFIGVALVVASVCGVWAVIAVSRHSTPVYAAAHTIVRGQPLTAADLTVIDVALGRSADVYLAVGTVPHDAVAARTVAAGELVPRAAAQSARAADTTTVVVRSTVPVPGALRAGAPVELWAAAQKERGVYEVPRILVPDATVAAVDRDNGMMSDGAASVELVIPRADVADALAAIAGGASLSVVPAGGRG